MILAVILVFAALLAWGELLAPGTQAEPGAWGEESSQGSLGLAAGSSLDGAAEHSLHSEGADQFASSSRREGHTRTGSAQSLSGKIVLRNDDAQLPFLEVWAHRIDAAESANLREVATVDLKSLTFCFRDFEPGNYWLVAIGHVTSTQVLVSMQEYRFSSGKVGEPLSIELPRLDTSFAVHARVESATTSAATEELVPVWIPILVESESHPGISQIESQLRLGSSVGFVGLSKGVWTVNAGAVEIRDTSHELRSFDTGEKFSKGLLVESAEVQLEYTLIQERFPVEIRTTGSSGEFPTSLEYVIAEVQSGEVMAYGSTTIDQDNAAVLVPNLPKGTYQCYLRGFPSGSVAVRDGICGLFEFFVSGSGASVSSTWLRTKPAQGRLTSNPSDGESPRLTTFRVLQVLGVDLKFPLIVRSLVDESGVFSLRDLAPGALVEHVETGERFLVSTEGALTPE